jgi:hypothetical protein
LSSALSSRGEQRRVCSKCFIPNGRGCLSQVIRAPRAGHGRGERAHRVIVQGGTFRAGERGQHPGLGRVEQVLDLAQYPASFGGEGEDLAAAVALVALAQDQAFALQAVDVSHGVAAVDAEPGGDVLLAGGPLADFAASVADPGDPGRLAPAFDSGDGIHLSDAGARALAGALDLALFT